MKGKKKLIITLSIVFVLVCTAAIVMAVVFTRHKHSYGEWVEVTPATCTAPGEMRRFCANCDRYETMQTQPLGHQFDTWSEVTAADCAHFGLSQSACVRCGTTTSQEVPPTDAHELSEFYLKSDTTHYHICVNDCDHTAARLEESKHTYAPGSSTCSVCGYDKAMTECLKIQTNGSYCTVTGFDGSSGTTEIVIPDFYNGLPVTTIAASAFQNKTNIEKVYFGKNITSIGQWSFYKTSISELIFPENLQEINLAAFDDCDSLSKIRFNEKLSAVGEQAFAYDDALTEVVIPDSISVIEKFAFYGCSELQSVYFGKNLTQIKNSAFRGCTKLNNVEFNDGLQEIGNEAFYNTGLTELTLPAKLKSMGSWAFYGCQNLETVYIGDEISTISYSAFNSCTKLQNVHFGKKVTKVDDYAFSGCEKLNNVEFNDGLQEIGVQGFWNTGFTELSLPDSLKTVGKWAFSYCISITRINFGDNLEFIDEEAFYYNAALENVNFGNSPVHLSRNAFVWCSDLTNVVFSENVKYVDYDAFYGCSQLIFYTDDQEVKYLGSPDNNYIVAMKAGNTGISSFTAKEETYVIASNAFANCSNLQTVVLDKNVHSIGSYAFGSCRQLTSLTLGSNIKFIREQAFTLTDSIEDVYVPSLKDWLNITFDARGG